MPPTMAWLTLVVQLTIVPVFLGAPTVLLSPQGSGRDPLVSAGIGAGLVTLGLAHVWYWSRPWPARPRRVVIAGALMVLANVILLYVLDFPQPLVWLYPALVVGAGLPPVLAMVGVGLMALVSGTPAVFHGHVEGVDLVRMLGTGHAIVLAVVLAGLGMTAVRQLIAVNVDLHATRAELADLAVAADRERLARELHDLLGQTLSLIAVKAELASRLSARGDPSAETELGDVQRLARQAVRDVREAIAGEHAPSVDAELAAAEAAFRTAGIELQVDRHVAAIDPGHETTIAWALREAVTNVLRHSGARACRIALQTADGVTELEVVDDGRGTVQSDAGTGLSGLAGRVQALGGTFSAGPDQDGGFRLCVRLGTVVAKRPEVGAAR
jgi:two-component system, NarL family, sensor histidine kinase DesK